ncbi:hypothetical protein YC2023_091551 [Brassica napus]
MFLAFILSELIIFSQEGDFQTRSSPYSGQKPSRTLSESLLQDLLLVYSQK